METPPPRFTIDNSPQARQQRMRWYAFKVVEANRPLEAVGPDTFNDQAIDHALAWVDTDVAPKQT